VQLLHKFASDGVIREAKNDCGQDGLSKGKQAVCDNTKMVVIPEGDK
jgi:hypothetical protein